MKYAFSGLSIFCLLLVTSHSAFAAIYEFETRLITSSSSSSFGSIGDSVYVTLDYDNTRNSDGDYIDIDLSLNFEDGTHRYESDDHYVEVNMIDGSPRRAEDHVMIDFVDTDSTIGLESYYALHFHDPLGTALDAIGGLDLHLPDDLELYDFSSVTLAYSRFFYQNGNYTHEYFTAYAPLPLPPVIYLFISGIVGLIGFARYRTAV